VLENSLNYDAVDGAVCQWNRVAVANELNGGAEIDVEGNKVDHGVVIQSLETGSTEPPPITRTVAGASSSTVEPEQLEHAGHDDRRCGVARVCQRARTRSNLDRRTSEAPSVARSRSASSTPLVTRAGMPATTGNGSSAYRHFMSVQCHTPPSGRTAGAAQYEKVLVNHSVEGEHRFRIDRVGLRDRRT
jgi:hypothetical protein